MRRTFSPAVDACLQADYPEGVATEVILTRINALLEPGEDTITACSMTHRVHALKLRRPLWFMQNIRRTIRDSEVAARRAGTWVDKPKRISMVRDFGAQKPLPIARSLPGLRDGAVSIARREVVDEVRAWRCCRIDLAGALDWGRRNAKACNGDLVAINAARREAKLPAFEVFEAGIRKSA